MQRNRTRIWIWAILIIVSGVGGMIAMSRNRPLASTNEIPVAEVKRGEFEIQVHATAS